MEESISLKVLLQTLRKRVNLILSITFIAVAISGIVSYFFLTPIYQTSTQLLVNQSKDKQSNYQFNEVQANLQLINTYNVIIKSPAILEKVISDLNLDMTIEELNGKIAVGNEKDSQVLNLSVLDENPEIAAKVANKTADVFKSEIVKIMNVDNVKILSKATVTDQQSPIKPRPLINAAITLVISLIASVSLAFVLEYLDNTVKNEQEIEKLLGLPVLGVIATMDDSKLKESQKNRSKKNTRLRGETVGS
jgi:capsular polysaccharide biosynthesis protein